MGGFLTGATAVLVALSVTVYLSITGILAWKLALEEPPVRRALLPPLMPVFCQNVGIAAGVLAFAFRASDLAVVALLTIALGIAARTGDAASLHPKIEVPLLLSALGSLAAIGLLNVVGVG